MKVFRGKYYLTFEKHPEYNRISSNDYFHKTILNLFFTKLSIRVKAVGYDGEFLNRAKKCFPVISVILRGNFFKIDNDEFEQYSVLNGKLKFPSLYCYNEYGKLLGDLSELSWLVESDCIVDDKIRGIAFSKKLNGYIGFTHRAACTFKIGDKLFDEKWLPEDENNKKYKKYYKKNKYNKNLTKKEIILENMPYTERGELTCYSFEDCKKAAINFMKICS